VKAPRLNLSSCSVCLWGKDVVYERLYRERNIMAGESCRGLVVEVLSIVWFVRQSDDMEVCISLPFHGTGSPNLEIMVHMIRRALRCVCGCVVNVLES